MDGTGLKSVDEITEKRCCLRFIGNDLDHQAGSRAGTGTANFLPSLCEALASQLYSTRSLAFAVPSWARGEGLVAPSESVSSP